VKHDRDGKKEFSPLFIKISAKGEHIIMDGEIIIQLSREDVMTVEQILLDRDAELALKFVREKIEPDIKNSQREKCKAWK
jgi:hypothetical protein